jgi:hypothetical protein
MLVLESPAPVEVEPRPAPLVRHEVLLEPALAVLLPMVLPQATHNVVTPSSKTSRSAEIEVLAFKASASYH